MKKFKKFLMLVLIAIMAFVFVGCKKKPTPDPEPTPDTTPKALKQAMDYIYQLYKDKAEATPSDFTVVAKSAGDYQVVWTVTVTQGNATDVVVALNEAGTMYTVDVNEKSETEVKYTLKATITDAEGNTLSKEFNFSVPAFKELSYAEYMATDVGTNVTVKGVVTAVSGKAAGASYNTIYFQDADGAYYAYKLTEDPTAEGENQVKVGYTVRVTGPKSIYSGTVEINEGCTYEILDKTVKTTTPADYTAAYTAAKSLKEEALVGKQALLVTIKGVELVAQSESDISSGYYKFKIGVMESYLRLSGSVCPLTKAQQDTFKANHKAGFIADVTGVVCVYDGAFYLTPCDENAISNLKLPTLSDADAVAVEKANLTAPVAKVSEDTVVTVPVKGSAYVDQVAISWASDKECAVVNGDKITFTLPEENTTVTLTATLTAGETTETVTFEVTVEAAETAVYKTTKVETMVDGTYKFYVDCTGAEGGKVLYATGVLNSKGALETSEKASQAGDFVVAKVEGKENAWTIKVGEKYLVAYRNGTYNNMKLDDAASEWNWDETLKAFTATYKYDDNGTEKTAVVYFGTYLNTSKNTIGNTLALSYTSYVTGANAEKVGVSQFIGYPCTLKEVEYEFKGLTEAKEGEFVISADCTGAEGGKVLYATGVLNSKGALETTEKMSQAGKFTVAKVDGKENAYTIKVGEKYLVAYRNGTYNNMKLDDAASEWNWDETLKTFTATYKYDDNGTEKTAVVYFGTYLNTSKNTIGNTLALSYTSYVTGANAEKIGVSQFIGYLGTIEEVGGDEPIVDPEPEEKATLTEDELAQLNAFAAEFVKDYNATTGTSIGSIAQLDTDYIDSSSMATFGANADMLAKWGWLYDAIVAVTENNAMSPDAAGFDWAAAKGFYLANINGLFTQTQHKDTWLGTESFDWTDVESVQAVLAGQPADESTDVIYVSDLVSDLFEGDKLCVGSKYVLVGTNAFATLEEALAVVGENKTICLLAGNYAGADITVAGLTIVGPNANQNPNYGPRADEAVVTGKLNVQANNVTIKGIKLEGEGQVYVNATKTETVDVEGTPTEVTSAVVVENITVENVLVYGCTLNVGNLSNNSQFYFANAKNVVLKNNRVENDPSIGNDRPMIMYGYDIENLTVVGNVFQGRAVNYNDGIKIDNPANSAAKYGIKGNVVISDNVFDSYQQYVIWFRLYQAGTYTLENNTFKNLGITPGSHAAVNFITFGGEATDEVTIKFAYNTIENSMMMVRIDAAANLTDTNAKVNVNYNSMVECGGTYYVKNATSVSVNADNNYWNAGVLDSSKNTGVASAEGAYTDPTEVPSIGSADLENNTYTIEYDLNGGTWFIEGETSYVYGEGYDLSEAVAENGELVIAYWVDQNGQKITTISSSMKGNLKLKAVWEKAPEEVAE